MKLVKHPNKWLHTKVNPFDYEKLDAAQISEDMIKAMAEFGGIGLSANQVALDAQIFVMQPTVTPGLAAFEVINPIIFEVSEETQLGPEGCLSYPDLWPHVKRPKQVTAKFFDKNQKECILTLVDLDARCFLHEYDHLQGITFEDRISRLKLNIARKRQLKRLKNG